MPYLVYWVARNLTLRVIDDNGYAWLVCKITARDGQGVFTVAKDAVTEIVNV